MKRSVSKRFIWVVAACILALGVAWASWSYAVISRPNMDDPRPADAIVVMGAPEARSLALADKLGAEQISNNLVISTPILKPTECSHPPAGTTVTCFVPRPSDTRGEAEEIGRMAARRGWSNIVVITWTEHISRSHLLIKRCFKGTLQMVAYDNAASPIHALGPWLHQTAGFVKAFVHSGC